MVKSRARAFCRRQITLVEMLFPFFFFSLFCSSHQLIAVVPRRVVSRVPFADVTETVATNHEVITLIRARSDVSDGLIMLAAHAALGVVDPATRTHRMAAMLL